jgi:hypothetical protein
VSHHVLVVHGDSAQSGVPSSFTLKPGEDFKVVVRSSINEPTTYTVHYLPPDLPRYRVSTSAEAGSEDILLTAENGSRSAVAGS